MLTMRWLGTGRSARGAPAVQGAFLRRSLPLLMLAAFSLAGVGCQSGLSGACGGSPCGSSPCGSSPCGSSIGSGIGSHFTRLRERIFNRSTTTYYGPTLGAEAPLVTSPAIVSPDPVVTPAPIVPMSPSSPAETPTDLSPLGPNEKMPSAEPGKPAGETGAAKSGNRANYEATGARNRLGRARGDSLTRTLVTTSEPATGSARRSDPLASAAESSDSLLENLPPVEVPHEWTNEEVPVAETSSPTPSNSKPEPLTPAQEAAPANPHPPIESEPAKAAETITTPPAEVSAAPGIRRFQVVENRLAGGSLPTNEGLDWLVEKGYKTILDVRDISEMQASFAFAEEVTKRGMRYVVLPIGLKQVDSNHISRFNEEIALADARPLYFCDNDGTRAGVLWYIRRMTVDRIDAAAASREAESLGLSDKAFWQAATKYLESLNPSTAPAQAPAAAPAPSAAAPASTAPAPTAATNPPAPTPASSASAEAPKTEEPAPATATKPDNAPNVEKAKVDATAVNTDLASRREEEESNATAPSDSTSWHPYAALVVTGLGMPLAYWSRTALPSWKTLTKASLPAPKRRLKSIPGASGDGK